MKTNKKTSTKGIAGIPLKIVNKDVMLNNCSQPTSNRRCKKKTIMDRHTHVFNSEPTF